MSLCRVNYFELKTIKAQEIQEEPSTFPQMPKRISIEGQFPKYQFPEISVKNAGWVWWGNQADRPRRPVPLSLPSPANTGFQTFAFPSSCQLAFSPLKSQTTAPTSSFVFS